MRSVRQDHLVGGHRQVDVHELQPVDLGVAVGIAALHVDQGDVRIERGDEQQLLAGERAIDLHRARDAACRTSDPSIDRIGMNGTPMAPARNRMPIAMWLHSS